MALELRLLKNPDRSDRGRFIKSSRWNTLQRLLTERSAGEPKAAAEMSSQISFQINFFMEMKMIGRASKIRTRDCRSISNRACANSCMTLCATQPTSQEDCGPVAARSDNSKRKRKKRISRQQIIKTPNASIPTIAEAKRRSLGPQRADA